MNYLCKHEIHCFYYFHTITLLLILPNKLTSPKNTDLLYFCSLCCSHHTKSEIQKATHVEPAANPANTSVG